MFKIVTCNWWNRPIKTSVIEKRSSKTPPSSSGLKSEDREEKRKEVCGSTSASFFYYICLSFRSFFRYVGDLDMILFKLPYIQWPPILMIFSFQRSLRQHMVQKRLRKHVSNQNQRCKSIALFASLFKIEINTNKPMSL